MPQFPTEVRIYLRRSRKTGLFAAVSDDLPGLMTVAHTIEEIEERLPPAIQQLIKAQYDQDVEVHLEDTDDGSDDFKSLSDPRVAELHAA